MSVTSAACYWLSKLRRPAKIQGEGNYKPLLIEKTACVYKNRMVLGWPFWRELLKSKNAKDGRIYPRESVFWIRDTTTYSTDWWLSSCVFEKLLLAIFIDSMFTQQQEIHNKNQRLLTDNKNMRRHIKNQIGLTICIMQSQFFQVNRRLSGGQPQSQTLCFWPFFLAGPSCLFVPSVSFSEAVLTITLDSHMF